MDSQQILINSISELFNKYSNNAYILNRLEIYLINLPNLLENENKKHDERVTRINELIMEQDSFYKIFLSKNQYYYMPYNNIYYEYDGKTYKIIKEDDIHHNLLSTITDEGKLIVWKHKTKQNIIKKIKDRNLLKSTPETYTIQTILSFLNTIFETKTESKYFLTLIGDCILKKNVNEKNLLYFVSPYLKKIITIIDTISHITTGNTIINNFITKYHDSHDLTLYRLIKNNDNKMCHDFIKDLLNKIGIDLLCVAAHYSDRYENAENYLKTKAEDQIKNYTLFFVNNSIDNILLNFDKECIEFIEYSGEKYTISWKNMHYIWKQYLASINIPNVLYSNTLKDIFKSKYPTIQSSNGDITFWSIISKGLPKFSSFLQFWENHITCVNDNNGNQFELDELLTLYKTYCTNMSIPVLSNETDIIKILNHYFPQVEIDDNKYINNILCNLWNKNDEINEMLQDYKTNKLLIIQQDISEELISFDELYENYKNYCNAKIILCEKNTPVISKQYFEKFIEKRLEYCIKFDRFISLEKWLE
jgi:hypothetical protein